MKGRKPQPIEARIKSGNAQHRPLPQPVLVGGRPEPDEMDEPPDHLPADAKRLWRENVPRSVRAGIIDRCDRPSCESACTFYAHMLAAERMIQKAGMLTTGRTGDPKIAPWVHLHLRYAEAYDRIAEQFGWTPVSRARLGLAEIGRRTLAAELEDKLGPRTLTPITVDNQA